MNAPSKIERGRMTSKGQVLIPKAAREAAGLKPNAPYKLRVNEQNQIVIEPLGYGPEDAEERVRRMREGIAKLRGTSKLGMSTDEYMKLIRGDYEP
jgi:antitoxin PrlF